MSLFCDPALAARIEREESSLMAEAASAHGHGGAFAMPLAGGFATFAGHGSPFNKVAGLGFGGIPDPGAYAEIERAFGERRAPVQVELSALADAAIAAMLTERGYTLAGFENVLGLALDGPPDVVAPPGVQVRPSGDDELDAWLDVVADASLHADTDGVPSHETFSLEAIKDADRDFAGAGVIRYSAVHDGELAGGASFRIAGGIAQMTGAATAPAHRRHGIQTALLTARLADAAAAGCDVAVVTTQPGSKSQQNVQRRGFDLLYARAILVKPVA
jgi:ribosomal protein S18 acetylase RimI-like enzyme